MISLIFNVLATGMPSPLRPLRAAARRRRSSLEARQEVVGHRSTCFRARGHPRVALDNRGTIWESFIFGQKIIIFHDLGWISWIWPEELWLRKRALRYFTAVGGPAEDHMASQETFPGPYAPPEWPWTTGERFGEVSFFGPKS